jgi:O-antigen/teichoic acid export membrane protein
MEKEIEITSQDLNTRHSYFKKTLKSISKQSGLILLGKVGFQIITFFSSILLARILGASLLGQFQMGLIVVQLLSTIGLVGFDRGLLRYIPIFNLDDKGKTRKLIQQNITIALGISICFMLGLYFSSQFLANELFHSSEMIHILKIYSFFIPVLALFSLGLAVLRGFKRADIGSHIEYIFSPVIFTLFLIIILWVGGDIFDTIIARFFSRFIGVGIIIYFLLRNFSRIFRYKMKSYNIKEYISYSTPLLLIGILYLSISKINILFLGYFVDSGQVGIFTILVYIAALIVFMLQAVNTILAPYIAEIHKLNDFENLEKLLKVFSKWIFYFSLFVFAFIAIFKVELLEIYGESFKSGAFALVIIAFGQLANAFAGTTGTILLMTGKQKWEILNSISALSLNVIFNIIFIPKYGINGAAFAFTLSLIIINIFKVIETYKEFKIHPYSRNYFKGTIAILIASLATIGFYTFVKIINMNFILIILFGGVILTFLFVLVLYLLKFDDEDILILKKLTQKFKS